MRRGHRDAQAAFTELGRALGYRTATTYSQRWPTDGVWFSPAKDHISATLPVVAIEVLVSESPKTMRGSLGVLEAVSPALGVLLVQDEDITRRLRVRGEDDESVQRRLRTIAHHLDDIVSRTNQRVQIWTYAQLQHKHHLATHNTTTGNRRPAA